MQKRSRIRAARHADDDLRIAPNRRPRQCRRDRPMHPRDASPSSGRILFARRHFLKLFRRAQRIKPDPSRLRLRRRDHILSEMLQVVHEIRRHHHEDKKNEAAMLVVVVIEA